MRIGINQFCFPAPCDVSEALHRAKGLGYDCMEICLTADRKPGPAVGSVTDALDISGYFNRLLHEHAGEAEFLQLRRMAEEVGIPLCSVGGIISFSIYPLTAREPEVVQTSMDAVRRMLDAAGLTECKIVASNSLDEYIIRDLLLQGAKIDSFGVGERLITAKSEPVFGGVYKLVAVERPDGTIEPKIKISENVGKITNPHFKKLYRFYGADTGKAIADYLCLHDETVNDGEDLEIFDPEATWKRKKVYNFHARELQVPVFRNGELVYQLPTLDEIRSYCREQVDTLWDEVKRFDNPHTYYVDLSQKLWEIKYRLLKDNACGEHHA